jgi:DAK2 domain fusion protein YloV
MPGTLDPSTFRLALTLFHEALVAHRDELDSLNVYPVPDGDTGTNMLRTQEAVVSAISELKPEAEDFESLGDAVAQASLMGARGNSGVILSQVMRGITDSLRGATDEVTAEGLASALDQASHEAWRAVARPAEGTILTVLGDSARAAGGAARGGSDVLGVAESALAEARASLERTRELNPELARAAVVDAGGKGIVLLLDALRAALTDGSLTEPVGPLGPVGHGQTEIVAEEAGFEVQYLLAAREPAVSALRKTLDTIGDSLVVVGGGGLFNVHVHTGEPDAAVEAGRAAGDVRDVSIVDLAGQVRACLAGQARAVRVAEQATALVAVAEGDGLSEAFASLGAVLVGGGPGNNPSVADLAHAIDAAPADAVIVLPNHRNVVPAAERAAQASSKRVHVVTTQSIPAGLSAATAFNPMLDANENATAMEEAAAACRSGEVTRAERDADTPAGTVRKGEWLGLVEGKAVSIGRSPVETALEVAGRLAGNGSEVLTLVVGIQSGDAESNEVAAALGRGFPELEVQVVRGGQPRYPYLIGVE